MSYLRHAEHHATNGTSLAGLYQNLLFLVHPIFSLLHIHFYLDTASAIVAITGSHMENLATENLEDSFNDAALVGILFPFYFSL